MNNLVSGQPYQTVDVPVVHGYLIHGGLAHTQELDVQSCFSEHEVQQQKSI